MPIFRHRIGSDEFTEVNVQTLYMNDSTYFETVDREEAAENAFFEACSEHYNVVFFIHGFFAERERIEEEEEEEK